MIKANINVSFLKKGLYLYVSGLCEIGIIAMVPILLTRHYKVKRVKEVKSKKGLYHYLYVSGLCEGGIIAMVLITICGNGQLNCFHPDLALHHQHTVEKILILQEHHDIISQYLESTRS